MRGGKKKRNARISNVSERDLKMAKTACDLQLVFCSLLVAQIDSMKMSEADKSNMLWTTVIMSVQSLFEDDLETFISQLRNAHAHHQMMEKPAQ